LSSVPPPRGGVGLAAGGAEPSGADRDSRTTCEHMRHSKMERELVTTEQSSGLVHELEAGNFGDVLVVGGGISGIQAALDLSSSGFKVYLVEKSPSIGGHMAQLDKTFPTNDCSM